MRKNYLLCIRIETSLIDKLRKEAENNNLPISEIVRQKLIEPSAIEEVRYIVKKIHEKLISRC
ncbi:MAG: hypothetical protein AABW89_05540 [Nanoarchaeota archaeon]